MDKEKIDKIFNMLPNEKVVKVLKNEQFIPNKNIEIKLRMNK